MSWIAECLGCRKWIIREKVTAVVKCDVCHRKYKSKSNDGPSLDWLQLNDGDDEAPSDVFKMSPKSKPGVTTPIAANLPIVAKNYFRIARGVMVGLICVGVVGSFLACLETPASGQPTPRICITLIFSALLIVCGVIGHLISTAGYLFFEDEME